jgi:hypothetical protein
MKHLMIVAALFAPYALQPALAGEAGDTPAPTTQTGTTDDTGQDTGKTGERSGGKKPAAEEAEPECD